MDKVIELISKFEGIIGTLVGVVATLITTTLIKKIGKIYFYFNDYESNYIGDNPCGSPISGEGVEMAASFDYSCRIEIYNNSEVMKVLKDIKIEFKLQDKSIYSTPINKDATKYRDRYSITKDLNIINLPPKQIIEINIEGCIRDYDMVEISKTEKIYLTANNYRNKKIRKLIKKF